MYKIPLFKAEADLVDKIEQRKISYAAKLEPCDIEDLIAELGDFKDEKVMADKLEDLYPIKSLLVSTIWNLNDDVFPVEDVWAARHTPAHKPINYEHDSNQIIGHMTESFGVNDNLEKIAESSTIEDLPCIFHLIDTGFIYKLWSDSSIQEKVDQILTEIPQGSWAVSMECWLSSFDYAFQFPSGEHTIIARNDKTSFLTKHLRAYGGNGEYDGGRVGRLLRGITFAGKGLVRHPANPPSKIFSNKPFTKLVYSFIDAKQMESNIMSDTLQKEIDSLREENRNLQKTLSEHSTKDLEGKLVSVQAELVALGDEHQKSEDLLSQAQNELQTASEKISDLEKQITEKDKAIADHVENRKRDERVSFVKEQLKLEKGEAEELVDDLFALSDEVFSKHIERSKKFVKSSENDATEALDEAKSSKDGVDATESNVVSGVAKAQQDIYNYFKGGEN